MPVRILFGPDGNLTMSDALKAMEAAREQLEKVANSPKPPPKK